MGEWISVKHRLPSTLVDVLTITSDGEMQVDYYMGAFWNGENGTERIVTHWMPLPEPPKEMRTIIATIQSCHLGNIRCGKKVIEVRKTAPDCQYPVKVLLCESGSGGFIKAEFTMWKPIRMFAEEIKSCGDEIKELAQKACLIEQEIIDYLGDAKQLYFWDISYVIDYCATKGYRIRNISEFGLKRAPQSWQYVDEVEKSDKKA